jgi:hypothetical protein
VEGPERVVVGVDEEQMHEGARVGLGGGGIQGWVFGGRRG